MTRETLKLANEINGKIRFYQALATVCSNGKFEEAFHPNYKQMFGDAINSISELSETITTKITELQQQFDKL